MHATLDNQRNYNQLRKIFWMSLHVLIVGSLILFLYSRRGLISEVLSLSFPICAGLALFHILGGFLSGLVLRCQLLCYQVVVTRWRAFLLQQVSMLLNLLPMKAGFVWRTLYLKQEKRVALSSSFGMLAGGVVCAAGAASLVGVVTVFFSNISLSRGVGVLAILFASVAAAIVLAVFLIRQFDLSKIQVLSRISKQIEEARCVLLNTRMLVVMSLFTIVGILIGALRIQVAYQGVHVGISFENALLLSTSIYFVRYASFLPGNLGVKEWLFGIIGYVIGVDFELSVLAAALDRGAQMIFLLLIGGPAYYIHSAEMKNSS